MRTIARPCHHRGMDAFTLGPNRVCDFSIRLLDNPGTAACVPACELEATMSEEWLLFSVRHGIYSFPTL